MGGHTPDTRGELQRRFLPHLCLLPSTAARSEYHPLGHGGDTLIDKSEQANRPDSKRYGIDNSMQGPSKTLEILCFVRHKRGAFRLRRRLNAGAILGPPAPHSAKWKQWIQALQTP